jgi:cyanate lyase
VIALQEVPMKSQDKAVPTDPPDLSFLPEMIGVYGENDQSLIHEVW